MTEATPDPTPTAAESAAEASKAKKAAASARRRAQRAQGGSGGEKKKRVMVYMRGTSHGASDGQRRYFDEATAERLVRLGHARRPQGPAGS